MTEVELLQRRLEREKKAREQAEALLEQKSRELYEANQKLIAARDQALEANAELRQQTALVRLLQVVAVAANEAPTPVAALRIGIDQVCAYTGWPVGDGYILASGGSGELVPAHLWHLEHPERFQHFQEITDVTQFPPGIGLPGRVLANGKPAWIMDVTKDSNFPRAKAATDIGVKGAFGFPVLVGTKVVAVLEFFTGEPQEPNDSLLQAMAHIGTQLGRVFERQRAEEELHRAKNAAEQRSIALEQAVRQLKAAQDQLVVQEKLASLGALTAGIAHEIKNPLNFVTNFAQLAGDLIAELHEELAQQKDRLAPAPYDNMAELLTNLKQNFGKISEHGQRADGIVRAMLLHSRGRSGERQATDLNALLTQYISLAYHGMRAQDASFNVTIDARYDRSLGLVPVVPQEMGRVFLNIAANACYAVREKKKGGADGYSPTITLNTKNMGDRVEVRIRDNGNGIPAAIRDNIFQPFFTTKPTGAGTGLGLSISYDIVVRGHQGTIGVETEEGSYTEFIIILPIHG